MSSTIVAYPLYDMPPPPTWYRGRVAIIGDAAHATSPHAGQGASLAVEDALVLAQCLRDLGDAGWAFACFEALRRERVEKIVSSPARCALGIPALRDRVAQMALKLVLEPIFESGFYPSSYAYRPGRRAQDAIAEIVHFTHAPSNYEWVVETDIEACFDRV